VMPVSASPITDDAGSVMLAITLDGLGCNAPLNAWGKPVDTRVLPLQLRGMALGLGSIQWTPGLEAQARTARAAAAALHCTSSSRWLCKYL